MNTIELYERYVNTSFVKGIEPVVVERASGATIWSEGREYTDLFAGISVVNAGHCNPRVVAAAKAQMEKLVHAASYIYYVPEVGELARKLAKISPGRLQKTFFGNSGAEAIEGAMRLAKASTGRSEFIALQMSFHGRTNASLAVTGELRAQDARWAVPFGRLVRSRAAPLSMPLLQGELHAGVR